MDKQLECKLCSECYYREMNDIFWECLSDEAQTILYDIIYREDWNNE